MTYTWFTLLFAFIACLQHAQACSPMPGWKPSNATTILKQSTFAAIAKALESSSPVGKPDIYMSIECVLKTNGTFNPARLLNGPVLVGPFRGSAGCSSDVLLFRSYIIHFEPETVKYTNNSLFLRLRHPAGPHSDAGAVPQSSEIQAAVNQGPASLYVMQGKSCPQLAILSP